MNPPRAGKGPQKSVFPFFFFFFFLSGIAQEASSLKMTKGRRQQKSSHARRGMARLTFEWHFAQTPSPPRSAGEPCTCREKFGPRPIFKIFSLDQIRVDQEKKEVRKRRASIYRTSPSDAVEHFLVSHVITSIVVIEFVISKNRRLGAISTTLNGHLLVTVLYSL